MKNIPADFYTRILDVMPLLCVDVVLVDKGRYVLLKRKNEPMKGKWWIPGGRVLKGETLEAAARRKVKEELGIKVKIIMPLGYYEGQWKESEFVIKTRLHTVSIVFLALPLSLQIKLDAQSFAWRLSHRLPKRFVMKPFFGNFLQILYGNDKIG